MTSVISAFSLCVLIFVSGCFTLPTTERSSTFSSFDDGVTTEKMIESDSAPELEFRRLSSDHFEFTAPTSTDEHSLESFTHESRFFDEHSASEQFTVEPTTESNVDSKRFHDDLLMTTEKSTTEDFDHVTRSFDMDFEATSESTSESTDIKRFFAESSFGTTERAIQDNESRFKTDFTTEFTKSKTDMESTTDFMTTITSTIVPEFYTTESYSTMPTEKFVGHFDDESVREDEHEDSEKSDKTEPSNRARTKQTHRTAVKPTKDESDEDEYKVKNTSNIPEAELDQSGIYKHDKIFNNVMVLDEKHDVITESSIKLTTDIMKNETNEKMLNQGKESSHVEEKESDH